MNANWLTGSALAFDVESTGVDVFNDRIVTACAVLVGQEGASFRGRWLLNPGVEIPDGAALIHGITTAKAQADGVAAAAGVALIADSLRAGWVEGLPAIICNAHFDLTMMQAELARYGLPPLTIGPVLDPLVIDRGMEPYRKGKRRLSDLAARYLVKQDGAHSSDGDALTAARVVWKQARLFDELRHMTLEEMQAWQSKAHAEWAGQFELWLRQQGKHESINREWPVRRAA